MSDLKLPVALVLAMAAQLVAGVWWVSKQAHTIEDLSKNVLNLQEELTLLQLDTIDLIDFAIFTENKWSEAYDEDVNYVRKFGTK